MPVKVLQSLKESKADVEDKYAFARRLSPSTSQTTNFSDDEVPFCKLVICVVCIGLVWLFGELQKVSGPKMDTFNSAPTSLGLEGH